jgi:hypothetical protein
MLPRREPEPRRWEASDQPLELWHGPETILMQHALKSKSLSRGLLSAFVGSEKLAVLVLSVVISNIVLTSFGLFNDAFPTAYGVQFLKDKLNK